MNERYSRQILFQSIGQTGQEKIGKKHVLLIGAGALGTSNAEMLVRAGVGKLTIIDRDYVEWSNLQRQQLYTEHDAEQKMPKAVAAKKRLTEINGEVVIDARVEETTPLTIDNQIIGVDLILDATDNFETRMLINDASQKWDIPWIYGACTGSYGLTFTIIPGQTPCLACLLGKIPSGGETCDTAGIISPTVQMVTSYQMTESLKILVEDWDSLRNTAVYFDLWNNQHMNLRVASHKSPNCTSCGKDRLYPFLNADSASKSTVLCGRDTVQIRPSQGQLQDLSSLKQKLGKVTRNLSSNDYLIEVELEQKRFVIFQDGRVLIHGTKDEKEARALYHRYISG
ncbi:MoeB/ThiF family adenylyltransferase [Alkalihalobacillus sp. AL-G]|uniref:MoeB/ThiF family adenylyltransferase n=1 Tax=Alkalihalobacillus sp. AL-G TaxID=2926399 RepID=UPI00272D3C89|nr:MoeB/ThiF family adenylyltransferase [Alkalihalobacillus sp. AL-G]WLD92507.1 MoeB/ThiF family adenylyltransferase [Alkalihalobacillus sp. AL-G]